MTKTATHSVIIERELPHPPEKIWRALTQAPLLEQWLMKNDFQPTPGHHFNFRAPPMPQWDGLINNQILILEPHSKLSYTWSALGLNTVVTWTLTPTNSGTHLRMEQSGFPSDKGPYFNGAQYGWQNFLNNLEQLLPKLD